MSTKKFKGTLTFRSPINREYSSTSVQENLSPDTESNIDIEIGEDGNGHAEWDIPELEETHDIGLSFEGNELVDYDGVFGLPQQLCTYLTEQGYDMSWAED